MIAGEAASHHVQPMKLDLHQDILASLEAINEEGIIADYWVSWVGTGGKLDPAVRTWGTGAGPVRDAQGLVAEGRIIVEQAE